MKFTFPKKVGDRIITIEFEAETPADFFEKIAFYDSLPGETPKGGTDLRFVVRRPKDKDGNRVTYYSVISQHDGLELKIGQHRNNPKSLFVKGEWVKLTTGRHDDDDAGDSPEHHELDSAKPEVKPDKISNRLLTDQQLDDLARKMVATGAVKKSGDAYVVRTDSKISNRVTKSDRHIVCDCERFKNAGDQKFRCEHKRAVALWVTETPKPKPQDELKLLITEMLEAGFTDDQIDGFVARVCDGVFAVEDLDPAQVAKAIRALNQKLEDRRLSERIGA